MLKAIYETIYKDLKQKIETDVFAYQELLPSENTLIQTCHCSRNICQPVAQTAFIILKEAIPVLQKKK